MWTFGGTAPGPVIRVREGDTVRFTLTNRSSLSLSHSIDFHAAQTPWDVNYQPVPPGESFTFDWVARFPGVFMYHCGVPPVLHHIANGMYGAIIVEPEEGLAPAREYVLVSSEFYPGEEPVRGVYEGDPARMEAVDPAYVVFNGGANRYVDEPLVARPNELVRLWVMNAGPTLTTALGALGTIQVSPDAPPAPASYPAVASPFDGGLTPAAGTVEAGGGAAASPAPSPIPAGEPAGGAAGATLLHAAITGFLPPSLHVPGPVVRIRLVNDDPMPHDFTIDELREGGGGSGGHGDRALPGVPRHLHLLLLDPRAPGGEDGGDPGRGGRPLSPRGGPPGPEASRRGRSRALGQPRGWPASQRRTFSTWDRGSTPCSQVRGSSQGGFPSIVKKLKRQYGQYTSSSNGRYGQSPHRHPRVPSPVVKS